MQEALAETRRPILACPGLTSYLVASHSCAACGGQELSGVVRAGVRGNLHAPHVPVHLPALAPRITPDGTTHFRLMRRHLLDPGQRALAWVWIIPQRAGAVSHVPVAGRRHFPSHGAVPRP